MGIITGKFQSHAGANIPSPQILITIIATLYKLLVQFKKKKSCLRQQYVQVFVADPKPD